MVALPEISAITDALQRWWRRSQPVHIDTTYACGLQRQDQESTEMRCDIQLLSPARNAMKRTQGRPKEPNIRARRNQQQHRRTHKYEKKDKLADEQMKALARVEHYGVPNRFL